MIVSLARIDCSRIRDWASFHDEFNRVFMFAGFYGRNMDAWIDCLSSLDKPDAQLTGVHCESGKVLTIELENAAEFKALRGEQYMALIECAAFVNWRRIQQGQQPVLALSFNV
jgi:RNAse (barnase) inhibitor barstar